jgi:hypothetical protein
MLLPKVPDDSLHWNNRRNCKLLPWLPISIILKLFSHRGHREHRDMEAENGREFDPAPSKQVPQAFAFSFWFLNVNPSAASVTSVANKFLIFLSFILFPFFG